MLRRLRKSALTFKMLKNPRSRQFSSLSWSEYGRRRRQEGSFLHPEALRRKGLKPGTSLTQRCVLGGWGSGQTGVLGHLGKYQLPPGGEAKVEMERHLLTSSPQVSYLSQGFALPTGAEMKLMWCLTSWEKAIEQGNVAPTAKCKNQTHII